VSPTDDDIRAMLAARAGRAPAVGQGQEVLAAVLDRVTGEPRRRRLFGVSGAMPRLATAAASIAAFVLVTVIVALPLANRPPASALPSDPASVAPSPTRGASPIADTGYYPGGIPRLIDGEPVLVGLDTQRRLAEATDDTSFLAGGFASKGPTICLGGIGPRDPNPLAEGCPRYSITGVPGRLHVPTGRMEVGDTPLVVRVHSHDADAETCWPEQVDWCRSKVVLDQVVWQGDDATVARPLGPREAIARVLNIAFADRRQVADNTTYYVDEPRFIIPISCAAPWPTLVYAARGDPRLGLLAVFRDEASRSTFQASVEPMAGTSCAGSAIARADPPRWIGLDNILVLAYADDPTANEIAAQLAWVEGAQRNTIALPDVSIDRSRETLLDYLDSRAAGPNLDGDTPGLTFGPTPNDADGNPAIDVDAGWSADVLRRY
jgi:hypothetical protein